MPDLVTAQKITREIEEFQRTIKNTRKPVLVKVDLHQHAIENDCFINVEKQVSDRGGSIVYGWRVYEMKTVFLEAEFHAVWRRPDGILKDVSFNPDGASRIVFFEDTKKVFNGERVMNVQYPLRRLASLGRYIELCRLIHEREQIVLRDVPYNTAYDRRSDAELARLDAAKTDIEGQLLTDTTPP